MSIDYFVQVGVLEGIVKKSNSNIEDPWRPLCTDLGVLVTSEPLVQLPISCRYIKLPPDSLPRGHNEAFVSTFVTLLPWEK